MICFARNFGGPVTFNPERALSYRCIWRIAKSRRWSDNSGDEYHDMRRSGGFVLGMRK